MLHSLIEGTVQNQYMSKDIAIVYRLILEVTKNEALVYHYELHRNIIMSDSGVCELRNENGTPCNERDHRYICTVEMWHIQMMTCNDYKILYSWARKAFCVYELGESSI